MKDNKLIAEFMGSHIKHAVNEYREDYYHAHGAKENGKVRFQCAGSKEFCERVIFDKSGDWYHNSWNWIIPVLTKIEKEHDYFSSIECIGLGIYEFSLTQYYDVDADELELPEGLLVMTDKRATSFDDARLEAVYKGVVEFIKWYNENYED